MAQCTAPRNGHRTASAAANCPACSSRYGRGYSSYSNYSQSYSPSSGSYGKSFGTGGKSKTKARWSSPNSSIFYTIEEIRTLTPVRANFEKRSDKMDLRDVFLCHAWDDRKGVAKELHDILESKGISGWSLKSERTLQIQRNRWDEPLGSLGCLQGFLQLQTHRE